eukprot:16445159-Heterocapsa_arctica.AAC.1
MAVDCKISTHLDDTQCFHLNLNLQPQLETNNGCFSLNSKSVGRHPLSFQLEFEQLLDEVSFEFEFERHLIPRLVEFAFKRHFWRAGRRLPIPLIQKH